MSHCERVLCSPKPIYGFGILFGKRQLLENLTPYKLRPAPDDLPDRWMTGTQNHEGIMGAKAAVEYLASLSHKTAHRREALHQTMAAIDVYESKLMAHLLVSLQKIQSYPLYGITDPARQAERVPTLSITHAGISPEDLARRLAEAGIFVWHGNFYDQPVTESLGLEPEVARRAS